MNLHTVGRPRFDFYAPFYKIAHCDGAQARFFSVGLSRLPEPPPPSA